MLSKVILVVLGVIVAIVLYKRVRTVRIAGSEARQLVANGAMLIDVRSPQEFAGRHIEGAVNIPVQELGGRIDELGEQTREIVVYCQSGGRSAAAKRLLESRGFANVHDMGGIAHW
jgi:rhodanese-related sulfurtransferase